MRRFSTACALALACLAPASASAAIGDLDAGFSGDGKLISPTAGVFDQADDVAVQDDGKIVVVGSTTSGAIDTSDFLVRRYDPSGAPDPTFSGDGLQTIDFAGFRDGAWAVAVAPDGKIVVAGYASLDATLNKSDYAIVRLNPDGTLDASFSGDGKQTVDFGGDSEQALTVALAGDGRIVLGGYAQPGGTSIDFGLARLDSAGAPDPSFSGDGRETTSFGTGSSNAFDVAIDADGRIVAAGRFDAGGGAFDFALARYDANGVLDAGLSGDGKVTADFGIAPGIDEAHGVALQPDGKIVVAGFAGGESIGSQFAVARYQADGDPDPGFADDGFQTFEFEPGPDGQFPNSLGHGGVEIQADGTILVAGVGAYYNEFFEPRSAFALGAVTPDGTLDTAFSEDGKVTTLFDAPNADANALALDGHKVVLAGVAGAEGTSDVALARYVVDPVPTHPVDVSQPGAGGESGPPSRGTFQADSCIAARAALGGAAATVAIATRKVTNHRRGAARARDDVRRAERRLQRARGHSDNALKKAQRILGNKRKRHKQAKRTLGDARNRRARERVRRTEAERTVGLTC